MFYCLKQNGKSSQIFTFFDGIKGGQNDKDSMDEGIISIKAD